MRTWRELESDFKELHEALQFTRLDYQWGDSGEHFRLAGSYNPHIHTRFETLSYMAGQKLQKSTIISQYQEVREEQNPIHCWYKGLKHLTGLFRSDLIGQTLDKDGKVTGYIYSGSIDKIGEAATLLCLKMEAVDPENDYFEKRSEMKVEDASEQKSRIYQVWEKYGTQIVIGIIVTVVGGMILASLI